MMRVVKLRMSGRGIETDAPAVEDALDQVRDYLEVLRGVEEALAEGGASAIVWRIVGASRSSPLVFELAAFPAQHGVNIEGRVEATLAGAASGFATLQSVAKRPSYFTDKVLTRTQSLFERVTNGLGFSEADFGADLPRLTLTPSGARAAAENTRRVLKPTVGSYKELGSVEGYFQGVESDGFGRRIVFVRDRISGNIVKCIIGEVAMPLIETHEIGEIWRNRRIQVFGHMHFKTIGKISHIDVRSIRFLRSRAKLPRAEDIVDSKFTGGLRSEDYLEKLRDGSLP